MTVEEKRGYRRPCGKWGFWLQGVVVLALVSTALLWGIAEGRTPAARQERAYLPCTAEALLRRLEEDPASAADYQDRNVELTGVFCAVDWEGGFLVLGTALEEAPSRQFRCYYIESPREITRLEMLRPGEPVTVRGQITGLGLETGWSLQLDEIMS